MIKAWRWILGAWVLLVAQGAWAVPQAADAQALVKSTTQQVLARLDADRAHLEKNPGELYPLVQDLILPHFDFSRMSQWVLGRYWRTATDEQRQGFTEAFRDLLVRTYSKALLEYSGQQVEFLPIRPQSDPQYVTVRTEIKQAGGQTIDINYGMLYSADAWKVYDITVDGISLVTNYRSSFSSEIRQGGMAQLIERLHALNEKGNRGE